MTLRLAAPTSSATLRRLGSDVHLEARPAPPHASRVARSLRLDPKQRITAAIRELSSSLVACELVADRRPLLAADLFSGAGGMSLGLEQAGMRVVFGADFDTDALETHAHHFAGMSRRTGT